MSAPVPAALREPLGQERTADRLRRFVALLQAWQRTHNLVSAATLQDVWRRHVEDSLQLLDYVPEGARTWVDLGSGGGFPGLVCAIALDGRGPAVTLVEANAKKCAFLRAAARETGAQARVVASRIEDFARREPASADILSARALAPLPALLALAQPLARPGATCLFLKGAETQDEIAAARAAGWTFDLAIHPSRTLSEGRVLVIRDAACEGR